MKSIHLQHTLPNVFMERTDIHSDIWLKDVDFEKGKTYLVEAASGTGKSSLCSFIYGYRKDYQGRITFDEEDTRNYNINNWVDIRKHTLSILFQELRIFPELTSLENIRLKNSITNFKTEKEILTYFDMLGIGDKLNQKMQFLSFGQQQRVAFIRTLCQPFDFAFLDEPISHLDDVNAGIMGKMISEEAQRQGAGIICTSIGKHIELPYDKIFKL
jgi:ABC-type lipoprotein export system ATPase subunit